MGLHDLACALVDRVPYTRGATDSTTTAAQALHLGGGVCQDHAHLFIAVARQLGIPARYVSGYLLAGGEGEVQTHAWAEAWVSGRWSPFDLSNLQREELWHIRLAIGLDYWEASPVRGTRSGGGEESLEVSVHVQPYVMSNPAAAPALQTKETTRARAHSQAQQ